MRVARSIAVALPAWAALTMSAGVWTISYEMTTAHKNRAVDAYAAVYGRPDQVTCVLIAPAVGACEVPTVVAVGSGCAAGQVAQLVANPESKESFFSRMLACQIVETVRSGEVQVSVSTARTTAHGAPPITLTDP